MSSSDRIVPGERTSERLYSRRGSRRATASAPAFYHRLGVDDPFAASDPVTGAFSGELSFLSAAPYYAELRRMGLARRRILARLTDVREQASILGGWLAEPRMVRGEGIGRARFGLVRAEGLTFIDGAPEVEEAEEAPLDGGRTIRRLERLLRKAMRGQATDVAAVLADLAPVVSSGDMTRLHRIVAGVEKVSPRARVAAARRATRKLSGPARAMARMEIDRVEQSTGQGAVAVARGRMPRAGEEPRGLRPVLARSPSIATFQAPPPERRPEPVRRGAHRRQVVPVAARAAGRRGQPTARVAREARTQSVTSRGAPDPEGASSAPLPSERTRVPTERLARVAIGTGTDAPGDETLRGLHAMGLAGVDAVAPAKRLAARAHLPEASAFGGPARLASSPTGYLRGEVRRSRALAAQPDRFLEPAAPPIEDVRPEPTRRVAAAPPASRRSAPAASVGPARREASPRQRWNDGMAHASRRLERPTGRSVDAATRYGMVAAPAGPRTLIGAEPRESGTPARSVPGASASPARSAAAPTASVTPARTARARAERPAVASPGLRAVRAGQATSPLVRALRRSGFRPEGTATTLRERPTAYVAEAGPEPRRRNLRPLERLSTRDETPAGQRLLPSPVGPSLRAPASTVTEQEPRPSGTARAWSRQAVGGETPRRRVLFSAVPTAYVRPDAPEAFGDEPASVRRAAVPRANAPRRTAAAPAATPRSQPGSDRPDHTSPGRPLPRGGSASSVSRAAGPAGTASSPTGRASTGAPEATHAASRDSFLERPATRRRSHGAALLERSLLTHTPAGGPDLLTGRTARASTDDGTAPRLEAEGRSPVVRRVRTEREGFARIASRDEAEAGTSPGIRRITERVGAEPAAAPVATATAAARRATVETARRRAFLAVSPVQVHLDPEQPAIGVPSSPAARIGRRVPAARHSTAPSARAASRLRHLAPTGTPGSAPRRAMARGMFHLAPEIAVERIAGPSAVSLRESGRAIRHEDLEGVLRRIGAAVRAMDRAEAAPLAVEAARRAVGQPVPGRRRAVAAPDRGENGVFRRPERGGRGLPVVHDLVTLDQVEDFERDAVQSVWAERRSSVGAARSAAPGRRIVERSFAGAPGVETPTGRVVARNAWTPVTARSRAMGPTADLDRGGRAVSTRRAMAWGSAGLPLGSVLVPWVDEQTGLPQDMPAYGGRAGTPVPGRAARAARSQAPRVRPLGGTLDLLSRTEGGVSPRPGRPRFGAATAAPGTVLAPSAGETADAVDGAPSWARRAVVGSAVDVQGTERSARPGTIGTTARTGGGLLTALARASRPEDVVRVILERSGAVRSLSHELPQPAMKIIERIVRIGEDAPEGDGADDAVAADGFGQSLGARGMPRRARSASTFRGTLPRSSARSVDGVGATQVTRLANKLMKLIHLAEVERRVRDAQAQVRMAEDTASARQEGGQGGAGPTSGSEAPNIQALQRDVFEAVLRELELTQQRRLEDPDGSSIWW